MSKGVVKMEKNNLAKEVRRAAGRVGLPIIWCLQSVNIKNFSSYQRWEQGFCKPSEINQKKLLKIIEVLTYFKKIQDGQ
jgi:hypothetical protein